MSELPVILRLFNIHLEREFIPADVVNIMRPHKWANPFRIGPDGDRAAVLARYRAWLWAEIHGGRISIGDLAALHGKPLVCCCVPKPCHGEILGAAAAWAHAQQQRLLADDSTA